MRVQGLMIDLDGTISEVGKAIPGAIDALRRLREAGLPLRFVTNMTCRPRHDVLEQLRALGVEATMEELFTTTSAATAWLKQRDIRRIAPCVADATKEDFAEFTFDEEKPQAVVVGDLGSDWTHDNLNAAFRQLLDGAELVALQKGRYWISEQGLTLDAGAWIAALEYAASVSAHVVGKPNREFFEAAVASMGLSIDAVAMVGDDVFNDVDGAQRAGAKGILVRTGKFRRDALDRSGVKPDLIVDSLAILPEELGNR
jgi:phospholysine phosphohistidine inorganic pyrophosphate phosphatase